MSRPAWLRPSNWPRLAKCPPSGVTSEGQASAGGEASSLGTASHELGKIAKEHDPESATAVIPATAKVHGVDEKALAAMWENVREDDFFLKKGGYCEDKVALVIDDEITVEGSVDHWGIDPETIICDVTDYKTGNPDYGSRDGFLQLEVYAIGAAEKAGCTHARCGLWYWQLGQDGWALDEPFLVSERKATIIAIADRALAQRDLPVDQRDYTEGDHCTFCPGALVCPVKQKSLTAFGGLMAGGEFEMTVENAHQWRKAADAAEKIVKEVKGAFKALIIAEGEILGDDGKVWKMCHQNIAESTSTRAAHTREFPKQYKEK